jgi:hypothetical protein
MPYEASAKGEGSRSILCGLMVNVRRILCVDGLRGRSTSLNLPETGVVIRYPRKCPTLVGRCDSSSTCSRVHYQVHRKRRRRMYLSFDRRKIVFGTWRRILKGKVLEDHLHSTRNRPINTVHVLVKLVNCTADWTWHYLMVAPQCCSVGSA